MNHNKNAKAFTLIELLVVIAIIAILAGMLLPALASANYANDNIDRVLPGLRDNGEWYVLSLSTPVYTYISNMYGDKVFDCPNLYPSHYPGVTDDPNGRHETATGWYIGYLYNGGKPIPLGAGWTSPQRMTEDPSLVLFAEANLWNTTSGIIPHTARGARQTPGSTACLSTGGKDVKQLGAAGGHVATLDGSVTWRKAALWTTNYPVFEKGNHWAFW